MSLKVKNIRDIMEDWAGINLAEDWDNPGLSVGNPNGEVKKILVALDASEAVIDEAIEIGADIIVTHHPFIFRGIKKINSDTPLGRKIFKLIKNNISVYSAHTNLDVAKGGTNDVLAKLAGLKNIDVLDISNSENLYKLVVYVPDGYLGAVRQAMFDADAGHTGGYSCCTFSAGGKGTFKPLDGAKPFIGSIGEVEKTSEYRLETIVKESELAATVLKAKAVHPYEEMAYDTYLLEQKGDNDGIGRIGDLEKEVRFGEFAEKIKYKLGLKSMRIVGDKEKTVKRVGLCTGAGMEFLELAKAKGADVYISADMKYHEALDAQDIGMCIIDATHYASENIVVPVIKKYIDNRIKEIGEKCQIYESKVDGQPFIDI